MKRLFIALCPFLVLLLWSQISLAQVPRLLSYQGILTDSAGTPKPDGEYMLTFRLYDSKTDGSALWTETKTIPIERGLFSTQLGDAVPFGAPVKFDKPYWLSVQVGEQPELSPRFTLSATAYSLNAPQADSARIAGTVANNSITSAKIANGSIQLADLAQNGAADGQVLKWSSGGWTAAADEVGGGSGTAGGWTDNGAVVGLTASTDTVSINSTSHMGKLNVGGNIGLNSNSKIYFGTSASHLGALGNSLFAQAQGFTFSRDGESGWMRVDNATKQVGIGAVAMDDRLHVVNDAADPCWMRVETSHPTNWGQAGLRIKTPQNMWNLRMDLYSNANLPNGALSLHSQDSNKEVMTWLEDGKVGVGTTAPMRKLHVNGSAQVKDTLYASVVNAGSLVNAPGLAHDGYGGLFDLSATWQAVNSVTVNAPCAGYVLLFFTGSLGTDHTYNDQTFAHVGIGPNSDGTWLFGTVSWNLDPSLISGYYITPVSIHAVARVTSAGPHEFFAGGMRRESLGDPDAINLGGHLTALFVPATYGTVDLASTLLESRPEVPTRITREQSPPASLESRLNALTLELESVKRELASRPK